jgi:hypothetical protein
MKVGVSVGAALDALRAGKPVRRACWEGGEWLAYSDETNMFHWCDEDGLIGEYEEYNIGSLDLVINDYEIGSFDKLTGEPRWKGE